MIFVSLDFREPFGGGFLRPFLVMGHPWSWHASTAGVSIRVVLGRQRRQSERRDRVGSFGTGGVGRGPAAPAVPRQRAAPRERAGAGDRGWRHGRVALGGAGGASGAVGRAPAAQSAARRPSSYDQKNPGRAAGRLLGDEPSVHHRRHTTEPDLTRNGRAALPRCRDAEVALPTVIRPLHSAPPVLTIASNAAFSIPTTGTRLGGVDPARLLQFPNDHRRLHRLDGQCATYGSAPASCEWEARPHNTTNPAGPCQRFSAYVLQPRRGPRLRSPTGSRSAASSSAATVPRRRRYTLLTQPSSCQNTAMYPGAIGHRVNGVPWDQAAHGQTGCFSQNRSSRSPTTARSKWARGQGRGGSRAPSASWRSTIACWTPAQITNHY